ncbi:hypothetical protein C8J56DRAFT_167111 [Mycena floridula]|nr:hypothetical protein C8J56DRAFT_167111 [Mycena floridula]
MLLSAIVSCAVSLATFASAFPISVTETESLVVRAEADNFALEARFEDLSLEARASSVDDSTVNLARRDYFKCKYCTKSWDQRSRRDAHQKGHEQQQKQPTQEEKKKASGRRASKA